MWTWNVWGKKGFDCGYISFEMSLGVVTCFWRNEIIPSPHFQTETDCMTVNEAYSGGFTPCSLCEMRRQPWMCLLLPVVATQTSRVTPRHRVKTECITAEVRFHYSAFTELLSTPFCKSKSLQMAMTDSDSPKYDCRGCWTRGNGTFNKEVANFIRLNWAYYTN